MVENHKKVSFNIASEASYVYNLSGQKFIKNAKIRNSNETFWVIFKHCARLQTAKDDGQKFDEEDWKNTVDFLQV